MTKKIKVAILFGGRSVEHEVSIQSAKNVYQALDKTKYEPVLIGIDKTGIWHHCKSISLPAPKVSLDQKGEKQASLSSTTDDQSRLLQTIDVVFPVLHGTNGEDGTMQGFLRLANLPFVGADVLGSAIAMDKDVSKRLLQAAGIKIAPFDVINDGDEINPTEIIKKFSLPLFVKPANSGSSVGVSKVKNNSDLLAAIKLALSIDSKVVIEKYIEGREIECSVLGNDKPMASLPGEIVVNHEFYSYDAKYIDANGAKLIIPANLAKNVVEQIQKVAIQAFQTLCCEGMARVDFFVTRENMIYVNEINTIPGFTKISMYPKLWEASGISYSELIDKLITYAIERYERRKKLESDYSAIT